MPDNYRLQLRPKARAEVTITGDCWRFTVLTNALIRMDTDRPLPGLPGAGLPSH